MTVGEHLKEIRLNKGMTQKQVADACGMADSAIRKYESGKITPKYETLQRIAAALDVHVGELMGLTNYGDNIWAPADISPTELEDIRISVLKAQRNQIELKRIKERIAKKEHIVAVIELLNDFGLDIAVTAVDALVGNPRLSEYPSARPYFDLAQPPSVPPAPARNTDTPETENAAEGGSEPKKGE